MHGRGIKIANVRKHFGGSEILQGVDLDIQPGEFLTLLGPSGCGKSTLLRMIAGFDQLSSGSIHIGGRDITQLPPKKRDVAMVFQSYALYPHMTVARNIGIPLEMSRLSFRQRLPGSRLLSRHVRQTYREIEQTVAKVADQLDLKHLLDRKPAQLSGGQRQRVAVGRAIVRQPSVFLMDEPLSNLDAKLRTQLREEISDLHRRSGITFLYVTHDQTEAMAMSSRVALMQSGRIVQCARPQEIYNRPSELAVARFVGSVAINELPVTVVNGQVLLAQRALNLRAPEAPDGSYTLGLRPESLDAVPQGGDADFTLPLLHVEFSGSEVTLRCDGAALGIDRIRIQMRAERFDRLRSDGGIDDRVALRILAQNALLFSSSGQLMPAPLKVAEAGR
ncbi:ABC transporter ATP-binding protein [Oryzibacter oryziterrae]|uniref:ABC transporter ATP-binding protein n=1 Tax=Oryzibacter oryziterrae TaxID=2766474 RepID=UPI001F336336|nr:ABC transporter ATP-binding protein [Oryzibacter oryziterrae]